VLRGGVILICFLSHRVVLALKHLLDGRSAPRAIIHHEHPGPGLRVQGSGINEHPGLVFMVKGSGFKG